MVKSLKTINNKLLRNPEKFHAYVCEQGRKTVEGWLADGDLTALVLISNCQKMLGISGAMCEIGVHHGLFFIGLCLLRSPHEKALAIDVFEEQQLNVDKSGYGDYEVFLSNIKNHIGSLEDIEIWQSDSMKVKPQDVLNKLGGQKVRLFSVDGCHTKEHTLNDLMIAQEAICPGGVIVLDDFYNPWWPGVDEAVHFMFNLPSELKLKPIGYDNNKLFLTTTDYYDTYVQALDREIKTCASRWKSVILWETKAFAMALLEPGKVFKASPFPIDGVINFQTGGNSQLYQKYGWYGQEKTGSWSIGDATLRIDLSDFKDRDRLASGLNLSLKGLGFVVKGHPQTSVKLICNQHLITEWDFNLGDSLTSLSAFIPPEIILQDEVLEFIFHSECPKSLKELGISPDPRNLGFFVKEMRLFI